MPDLPFFPVRASNFAGSVDALGLTLILLSLFFVFLVAGLIVYFAVVYHHKQPADRTRPPSFNLKLEIVWTAVPVAIALGLFFWAGGIFLRQRSAPEDALPIYVVGKQWMWKIEHPEGRRENNELHVPVGRPVKLIMTSQDVIHSLFIPAFRVKQDVLPGRYTTEWFTATRPGEYHLFCSQYCGTSHSTMVGRVIAMHPLEYEKWLSGETGETMAAKGGKLFVQYACITCHREHDIGRGPSLYGIFGTRARLSDGRTVLVDEHYLRESILQPQAKIVGGYEPIMPTFQNLVSEEAVNELIAHVKSLGGPKP